MSWRVLGTSGAGAPRTSDCPFCSLFSMVVYLHSVEHFKSDDILTDRPLGRTKTRGPGGHAEVETRLVVTVIWTLGVYGHKFRPDSEWPPFKNLNKLQRPEVKGVNILPLLLRRECVTNTPNWFYYVPLEVSGTDRIPSTSYVHQN